MQNKEPFRSSQRIWFSVALFKCANQGSTYIFCYFVPYSFALFLSSFSLNLIYSLQWRIHVNSNVDDFHQQYTIWFLLVPPALSLVYLWAIKELCIVILYLISFVVFYSKSKLQSAIADSYINLNVDDFPQQYTIRFLLVHPASNLIYLWGNLEGSLISTRQYDSLNQTDTKKNF